MANVTKMNAEAKIEMTQDVPVVGNYDVVVCGGGPRRIHRGDSFGQRRCENGDH